MNLLMMAPLLDSRGNLRYFIGAQIDVSGLVKDGTDLEAYHRMLDDRETHSHADEAKDEFQELCEMFNHAELDIARKHGGNMHREQLVERDDASIIQGRPRVLIQDQGMLDVHEVERQGLKAEGRLSGPYKHVRRRQRFCAKPHTDICDSTSLSALRPLFAFCSPRRLSASQGSCSLNSWTALAAPNACATRFVPP